MRGINMEKIEYRILEANECERICEIDPTQYIKNAWRLVHGERKLIEIDYMENDWPDGYEKYKNGLEKTILSGGIAFGAFSKKGIMVGFSTLNHDYFGETSKYILLDSIFVSLEYRGLGIGKNLFELCSQQGKTWNADKLYICAGSA
jgi:GNAT superfamily N-acetyltransferase